MQRESVRRGFSLSHQKVVLDVDFSANINGFTELTILPTDKDLRTINLHCRQCHIQRVTVAGYVAEFQHHDPLAELTVSNPKDVHLWTELKRRTYSALAEGDEGELSIAIPSAVFVRQAALAGTPITPGTGGSAGYGFDLRTPIDAEAGLVVRIEYRLRHPSEGVNFVLPTKSYPFRVPHVYTTPTTADAARCWVPCVDNLWERCTWEFEFVVPRYLTSEEDVDMDRVVDDSPVVVICSGEFKEQVAHPYNSKKSLWVYRQDVLTSVQHVAFAAGPFKVQRLREEKPDDQADEESQVKYPMHAFCLPGLEHFLKPSTSLLPSAMTFFHREYGSYPFTSYSLVFVDELPRQRSDNACLTLASNDLLHGEDAIEQVYETRQILSHAVAVQWVGMNIIQKTWADTWLVNALGLYITAQFFRRVMGNNEYRFRMKKDMERICALDNGRVPPICQPGRHEPPDPDTVPFINLKGPVVLHILDRHLGKSGTSLGLSRVLPKIFLSSMSGEMSNNTLSTHSFLRTCRKVSGVDPKAFAEQWIYGSGCPRFVITASFNRKKMAVEVNITQDSPAYNAHQNDPVALALNRPVQLFEGPITLRIHEADGTPYEHVLNISSQSKKYEVPFNTKYKRVRRHTKRWAARQAAAAAAAAGDQEAADAMGMVDMSFGLALWEDEAQRAAWRVADWSEEEEHIMESSTYEWIRVDADFEWIASTYFDQPDFMWASQLQRDRDVVAQLEAVHALGRMPSLVVSSILTKTVLVENYFFRVRMEAALALSNCTVEYIGLWHLSRLFTRFCYGNEDASFGSRWIPQPNDFSDFSEYFVRKSVVIAISRCRDPQSRNDTWPAVRQIFIDQLHYNNNTKNSYSDARYLSTIIVALGAALLPGTPPEQGVLGNDERPRTPEEGHAPASTPENDANILAEALSKVERYRLRDQTVPSQHNVISIAIIEFYLTLMLANLIPADAKFFLEYTREANYTPVRLAAFDALLLMRWRMRSSLVRYFFSVITYDPSRVVRRHVARSMTESLGILFQMGDLISHHKKEPVLIEEDGVERKKKSDLQAMIKALKKEVGRGASFRECIMPALLSPNVDQQVRWYIIHLAEFLFKDHGEPLPKVTITLPPTPLNESAPPLPSPVVAPPVPALPKIKSLRLAVSSLQSPKVIDRPITPSASLPPLAPAVRFDVPPPVQESTPIRAPPKPKKEKPVPKAQQGGMSSNDLKACRQALKKLNLHKHADLFKIPVDPVRDKAPNYFEVIKEPMDLSTISTKLEEGRYPDRFAFAADFHLMIQNAHTYNAPGTYAYSEADQLLAFFDKQWARINKTLDAAKSFEDVGAMTTTSYGDGTVSTITPSTAALSMSGESAIASGPPLPLAGPSKPSIPLVSAASAEGPLQVEKPVASKPTSLKLKIPMDSGKAKQSRKRDAIDADLDDLLNEEVDAMEAERRPGKKAKRAEKPPEPSLEDDLLASLEQDIMGVPPSKPVSTSKAKGKEKERSREKERSKETLPQWEKETPEPAAAVDEGPVTVPPVDQTPSRRKSESLKGADEPINEKKCRAILKMIKALPQSYIFLRPVDPIGDGCPTYYDEIKQPMDFGTMDAKLSAGEYSTMGEFANDFDLVVGNCRKFNPPATDAYIMGDIVDKTFQKEWAKLMVRKLNYNEKRSLQATLNKARQLPSALFFLEPVDPVLLGIPTYFDVIPKKDARDLSTIKTKLDADKYDSIEALDADIQLMTANAIKFNGADSDVGRAAKQFEKDYHALMKPMRGPQHGSAVKGKRKEMEDSASPAPTSSKKKKTI